MKVLRCNFGATIYMKLLQCNFRFEMSLILSFHSFFRLFFPLCLVANFALYFHGFDCLSVGLIFNHIFHKLFPFSIKYIIFSFLVPVI